MVDYIYMTANLVVLCPLCGREALWNERGMFYICTNPECAYYKPTEEKWIKGEILETELTGGRRGFELVSYAPKSAKLPQRADKGSAGYDFYLPNLEPLVLYPGPTELCFTYVKAYMETDEVLLITIRSSLAKRGLILANQPAVIDSSYYNNHENEGNIGLLLCNISNQPIELPVNARVAQGIFMKYLVADNDSVLRSSRIGGCGSSGK